MIDILKESGLAPAFLTEEGFNSLQNGYLLENETPKDMYERVARYSASVYSDSEAFKKDFFTAMWNNWLCAATPVLSNAETKNLQISCYSSNSPDSLLGIMDHLKELAILSKYGGGCGSSLDNLRPAGSSISRGGTSSGIIPFYKMIESVVEGVKQGATRRGAVANYLNMKHPEAKDFINIRSQTGDLSRRCLSVAFHNAITIDDDTMNRVIDGDGDFRSLYNQTMNQRVETGEPYILFQDNANKNCPDEYKGTITQSNLCVAPETQILTDKGYKTISELENQMVNVWNGVEFSQTKVLKTGTNQKLIKVITNYGDELECTPYHKFYVQNKYSKNSITIKKASELVPGDKLIKFDLPTIKGELTLENAYANGFYSGDGCKVGNKQRIYLYGDKIKLKNRFVINDWCYQSEQKRAVFHYDNLLEKFFVPNCNYTIESRLDWLAGILDSDGTLLTDKNYGSMTIQLSSVEKEFLVKIKLMLQTLGVNSKINFGRKEGQYSLPLNDGSGTNGLFNCKSVYRLLINTAGVEQLRNLGLNCGRLNILHGTPNRDASRFTKVKEILDLGRIDDTYCFTEPKRNMGMFNGILTGNCSEIMAPVTPQESFVCCLSSLNLARYDEWKDYKFENTGLTLIELSIFFLDAVITNFIKQTENMEGMQNARRFAMRHRMLGLGVLGWHTLVQNKMLPFESFQTMQLNAEIFKKMRDQSYKASEKLATMYGACEVVPSRRNSALLAVAPTMSNSLISGGVSQGIEPLTANIFSQKSAKGTFIKKNPSLVKFLESKGLNKPEIWEQINKDRGSVKNVKQLSSDEKAVFLTAREINQFALVNQAAQRQQFIDQGQSLNLFFSLPPSKNESVAVAKYINDVHLEAWRSGVKSLYYMKTDSPLKGDIIAIDKDGECKSCEG